jgi:cysteine sulfinate desulfinase/cysteine desulfurase-like protein
MPEAVARGTIRLSLGAATTDRDLERALEVIPPIVTRALAAGEKPVAVVAAS